MKTTYEEAFRSFAPGILLEDAILRAFLDEGFAEKLDSASLPGSLLEGLFADRQRMADVVIATDPAISPRALAGARSARAHPQGGACAGEELVLDGFRPELDGAPALKRITSPAARASRPPRRASRPSRRNRA